MKKEDDVRLYVVRRKIEKEGKKPRVKAPKIQRLITDQRLRRKRIYKVKFKVFAARSFDYVYRLRRRKDGKRTRRPGQTT